MSLTLNSVPLPSDSQIHDPILPQSTSSTHSKRLSLATSVPRPLHLLNGAGTPLTAPAANSAFPPSSYLPSPSTPSNSAPRRNSSISYARPREDVDSPSPSVRRSDWSLERRRSMGQTPNMRVKLDRRASLYLPLASPSPSSERGPLTLTEKHADLLHFIAQKESKCLDLRQQLAQHETELVVLKRKWERIVSRGANMENPTLGLGLPQSSVMSASIREGVQEVGRRLVAATGLDTVRSQPASAAYPSPSPSSRKHMHVPRASTSSTSTFARTSDSDSQRLSASSASSLGLFDSNVELIEESVDDEKTSSGTFVSPSDASTKLQKRRSRDCAPIASLTSISPSCTDSSSSTAKWSTQSSSRRPTSIRTQSSPSSSMGLSSFGPPTAWVGSVGKRWGELQKTETFTKGQKRASLLLSDVLAALTVPSPTPSTSPSPFLAPSSPALSSENSSLPPCTPAGAVSLLDDDDEQEMTMRLKTTPALTPSAKYTSTNVIASKVTRNKATSFEDDEWNW